MRIKKIHLVICLIGLFPLLSFAYCQLISRSGSTLDIINQLGWIQTNEGRCGGYYLESPIEYPAELNKNKLIITSDEYLFAQHGTSIGQGGVTITRFGQQVKANKAYLYRNPETGGIDAIELVNNIILRQPNSLIVANRGRFNFKTKQEFLQDILYRTAIYSDFQCHPVVLTDQEVESYRRVYQLSAWGSASCFNQLEPKIFRFDQASYSTCPPTNMAWQVKASHIELNKITGRGTATNVRLLVRGIPVFYTPYLNFPIDHRRKTGFLWPTTGTKSTTGLFVSTPFYWNMAPNYDMTITPDFITKRGILISDVFRYITPNTALGNVRAEVLPNDKLFRQFQIAQEGQFQNNLSPITQAELRRLLQASTTRKSVSWQNSTIFDDHWATDIDYNYVSDDYYLKDLSNSFNQVTQNQLLQQGMVTYKNQYWNAMGRVQAYQTLHPVDEPVNYKNQYTRFPQIVINGDYPDLPGNFEFFVNNDNNRFDIRTNPGSDLKYPVGTRIHLQPGLSRPFIWPFFTFIPRMQFALTQYNIGDVDNGEPKVIKRALPIFDIDSSLYFDRRIIFFNSAYRQTLEPHIYYTYIPYRNQSDIPVFDTTVNTLVYDQLFMYNRFSSIDRINDANQVAAGLTTRFIDQETGLEKLRATLGQIYYFQNRRVTLCNDPSDPFCPNVADIPSNPDNHLRLSPLSAGLNYFLNVDWNVAASTIWNPESGLVDNQSILFHYQPPGTQRILNLGYNFVRKGDKLPADFPNSSSSNLSSTDVSFDWPIFRDVSFLGRWTQNWNHHHFQNLLYGLQYDSCCWAVRVITGRAFDGLNPSATYKYNTQFYIQIALKGLGTVPIYGGDPSQILTNNISGIANNFGRDF